MSSPRTSKWPDTVGLNPASASISSFCPFPDTPAIPRISPAYRSKLRSFTAFSFLSFSTVRPLTRRIASFLVVFSVFRRPMEISRPTISWASSCSVVSSFFRAFTRRPSRSTVIRSANSITSFILCVMKMMVQPMAAMLRRVPNSSLTSSGVRTAVGSSRIRILALRYSTFKISTRCCSPMDSCHMAEAGLMSILYSSDRAFTCCSRACVLRIFTCSMPSTMFSATVKGFTSLKCW